ncbi:MAG: hypothetical protein KW806_00330 [Candidatus Yanofskybacteria bacterium]|nr:hypothetical protein [Candidatus Yanofskybacteria bacterium]
MGNKLSTLYKKVDSCKFCKKLGNKLQHIYGYGTQSPETMLVLINPTYRNLSSHPDYIGPRFPFIGVRQFWNVLGDGGLIAKLQLPLRADWKPEHTKLLQTELEKNKLFLTNIVKCCYEHSAYPEKEVIADQLKLLAEEIRIVKPKRIIAFGTLVHKTLTGETIKLRDYLTSTQKSFEIVSGLDVPVMPVYFPIGRGNPKKAAEILRKYETALHRSAH